MADATSSPPPNVDRGLGLLAEEVTLTALALLTTVVRVGIRLYNRQARWDDLTITIAMMFRLVSFTFTMLSIAAGNGRHEYYLSDYQIATILKWTWANEILIFTTVCIIKIAICLHIFRIKNTGWLKWLLNITMVGLVVTNGACVIVLFAQCSPISAFWNHGTGTCWNGNIYNDFIYVSVGYSIVTDLLCTAMPIIILWNVRITMKQKVGICGLMFLGLVASACAAVRAYLSSLAQGTDLTYSLVTTDEWGFAEANVGIIGANLALGQMMYVFCKKHFGKPRIPKVPFYGGSWKDFVHVHRNHSGTTLYDTDDNMQTKDSEVETTANSNETNATTESSHDSMWPGGRLSNAPGTITRTIEYTVAGVPYNESEDQGPPPIGAPVPWDHRVSGAS